MKQGIDGIITWGIFYQEVMDLFFFESLRFEKKESIYKTDSREHDGGPR